MKNLFQEDNYKTIVGNSLTNRVGGTRGRWSQLAKHLGISPVIVTQVFNGSRELTLDQASDVCDFFSWSEIESRYFMLLVQRDRAGTHRYKLKIEKEIQSLRALADQVSSHVRADQKLTETEQAQFYSHWRYSAVRLLCSFEGGQSVEEIVQRTRLKLNLVHEALEFLLSTGLIKKEEDSGRFVIGPAATHLGQNSPFLNRHHMNWRLRGMQIMEDSNSENLFYTAPFTVSRSDFDLIRALWMETISSLNKIVIPSPAEDLYCVSLDLFKVFGEN